MSKHTTSRRDHFARAARILGTVAAFALLAGGCSSHGSYTAEHKNAAKARMEQLKSATEWQMAHQAFLAGDLPKALKHVNFSIELNENVCKSHVLKGRILMEQGQLDQASAAFAQAEKLDSKNADAWYYQGILAERIDRKEDALQRYLGAGELDTSNPQYAIAAAEMMMAMDRLDDAEKFLLERKTNFDHAAGIKQTLGHIAMLRGKPEIAAPLFNEARLLAPDDSTVIEDLIHAYIALGQYPDAESHLARLLATADGRTRRDLMHLRAKCLLQMERPVDARDLLLKVTAESSGTADTDAWIELGQVSYILQDFPKVRSAAGRVIVLAPTRPEGYALRGLFLRSTNDLPGAEQNFRKALELKPDAETYVLLGMTYREMRRPDMARACFQNALTMRPGDPAATGMLSAVESDSR